MPTPVKLDERLGAVADMLVRSPIGHRRHLDIGTDHAFLLSFLLQNHHIDSGIAVELRKSPHQISQQALQGLPAEVRLGDGLSVVVAGESDSLSICGMGGHSIIKILRRFPERLPALMVLQPNRDIRAVREWGLACGHLLVDECLTSDGYFILAYLRSESTGAHPRDPAYTTVKTESPINAMPVTQVDPIELNFGPWLLRRRDPHLQTWLRKRAQPLRALPGLNPPSHEQLRLVELALERL